MFENTKSFFKLVTSNLQAAIGLGFMCVLVVSYLNYLDTFDKDRYRFSALEESTLSGLIKNHEGLREDFGEISSVEFGVGHYGEEKKMFFFQTLLHTNNGERAILLRARNIDGRWRDIYALYFSLLVTDNKTYFLADEMP